MASKVTESALIKATDVVQPFLQIFTGRLKAAEALLCKGENEGKVVHQNRYQAKSSLQQLLAETAGWYHKQLTTFPDSTEATVFATPADAQESVAAGSLVLYVGSLAVCRTLLLLGRAMTDSMETIEGYLHVEAAVSRLDWMQVNMKPLPQEKVTAGKFAPQRKTAGVPKMVRDSAKRVSLVGSAMLLEGLVTMALANNHWGDPTSAMSCLRAAELLKDSHEAKTRTEEQNTHVTELEAILATHESAAQKIEQARAQDQDMQAAALAEKLAKKRAAKTTGSPPPTALPPQSSATQGTEVNALESKKEQQHDAQAAELAEKLAQKRAKKGGDPASFLRAFLSELAVWSGHSLQERLLPTVKRIVFPKDGSATTTAAGLFAALHAGLFTEAQQYEVQVTNVASFLAQIFKAQSQGEDSCYQSHVALARMWPAILAKPLTKEELQQAGIVDGNPAPEDDNQGGHAGPELNPEGALVGRKDWCRAALNLVEFYLIQHDISHAEHTLNAVFLTGAFPGSEGTVTRGPKVCALLDKEERMRYHYYTATVHHKYVKSFGLAWSGSLVPEGATSLDGVSIPLVLNPDYPPEDATNEPETAGKSSPAGGKKAPAWCRADRLPFESPVFASALSPPKVQHQVVNTLGEVQEHDDAFSFQVDLLASSEFNVNLDTECEMHLQCLRMRASADEVLFAFSDDLQFPKRRIATLHKILDYKLNIVSFFNVIQQALFDSGASAQGIAENEDCPDGERKLYLTKAHQFFTSFNGNYKKQLADAKKVKQEEDIFDPSDLPAFAIGLMREAYLALKIGRQEESIRLYDYIIDLFAQFPSALIDYPDLVVHLEQCKELKALLGGDGKNADAAGKARITKNAGVHAKAVGAAKASKSRPAGKK